MSTSDHLQHLADLFRSNGLEALVCLEFSERVTSQLVIWPYASEPNAAHRNPQPPRDPGTGAPGSTPAPWITRALVVPSSLAVYDQARRIVLDNPVDTAPGSKLRLLVGNLAPQEAAALFQAAQSKFRLALPVEIHS